MKNDVTYEHRVFTHRLFDIESMEVGICTSKVIKEIKPKDKINGRFFHTSDTDEWFFCWNDELQKLNLKGNSDVNDALEKVNKLIDEANAAVSDAENTAGEAKTAAAEAKDAADKASAAVESIDNKADKTDVESLEQKVNGKQDAIADLADIRANATKGATALQEVPAEYITETELEGKGYATTAQVEAKQDVIADLGDIRTNAAKGATALQAIPDEYVTETELEGKGYLTVAAADLKYAPIGSNGEDLSDYATKEFVSDEIAKNIPTVPTDVSAFNNDAGYLTEQDISGKQDVISDLDDIRANAAKGATALQEVPAEYVTETELEGKGYATTTQVEAKQDAIADLADIRANAAKGATALQEVPAEYVTETELEGKGYLTEHQSLSDYYTKQEVDSMIGGVNELIGQATEITNEILA